MLFVTDMVAFYCFLIGIPTGILQKAATFPVFLHRTFLLILCSASVYYFVECLDVCATSKDDLMFFLNQKVIEWGKRFTYIFMKHCLFRLL